MYSELSFSKISVQQSLQIQSFHDNDKINPTS